VYTTLLHLHTKGLLKHKKAVKERGREGEGG
jgi:hypothetical protein